MAWLLSNKHLTTFMAAVDDNPENHLLCSLREISSARFLQKGEQPFNPEKLTRVEVDLQFLSPEQLAKYTALRSMWGRSMTFDGVTSGQVNLQQLTWLAYSSSSFSVPLTVTELYLSSCYANNSTNLTKLEALTLHQPASIDFLDGHFAHLTKLYLTLKGNEEEQDYLHKLSNLSALRELSFNPRNNDYPAKNVDFLTTLPSLDTLDISQFHVPPKVLRKIVEQQSNLTNLQVFCRDSNGGLLTQLTNLQILHHFNSCALLEGLGTKLEALLPRLVECKLGEHNLLLKYKKKR